MRAPAIGIKENPKSHSSQELWNTCGPCFGVMTMRIKKAEHLPGIPREGPTVTGIGLAGDDVHLPFPYDVRPTTILM